DDVSHRPLRDLTNLEVNKVDPTYNSSQGGSLKARDYESERKLQSVKDGEACYHPSCRRLLKGEPYVCGSGKSYCDEECYNEHQRIAKERLEKHRVILNEAAEISDAEEREKVLLTSAVYAGNKKALKKDADAKAKIAAVEANKEMSALEKTEAILLIREGAHNLRPSQYEASVRSQAKAVSRAANIILYEPILSSLRRLGKDRVKQLIGARAVSKLCTPYVALDTAAADKSHQAEKTYEVGAVYKTSDGMSHEFWANRINEGTGEWAVWLDGAFDCHADFRGMLTQLKKFAGNRILVQHASDNAIDYNRLRIYPEVLPVSKDEHWLNTGSELLSKVNLEQAIPPLNSYAQIPMVRNVLQDAMRAWDVCRCFEDIVKD
ncbi:hypothetical protein HDV05_006627, partial [Chytridiales sp. JEL 0842]